MCHGTDSRWREFQRCTSLKDLKAFNVPTESGVCDFEHMACRRESNQGRGRYIVMDYIVMAYIVMAYRRESNQGRGRCLCSRHGTHGHDDNYMCACVVVATGMHAHNHRCALRRVSEMDGSTRR